MTKLLAESLHHQQILSSTLLGLLILMYIKENSTQWKVLFWFEQEVKNLNFDSRFKYFVELFTVEERRHNSF